MSANPKIEIRRPKTKAGMPNGEALGAASLRSRRGSGGGVSSQFLAPATPQKHDALTPTANETLKTEIVAALGGDAALFFTRQQLAETLQISISLVDLMVRGGEMSCLRVRGNFVRFYLPHVIRDLAAASAVSKRRFTRAKGVERGASERRSVNTQKEKLKSGNT